MDALTISTAFSSSLQLPGRFFASRSAGHPSFGRSFLRAFPTAVSQSPLILRRSGLGPLFFPAAFFLAFTTEVLYPALRYLCPESFQRKTIAGDRSFLEKLCLTQEVSEYYSSRNYKKFRDLS